MVNVESSIKLNYYFTSLFFLGFLCNCEAHFHFNSSSAVHIYDLCHMHIISPSSYNGYKLNSHLTCFQRGFIAQLVEHRTGIESRWSLRLFGGLSLQLLKLLHNCEILFTCISPLVEIPSIIQNLNHCLIVYHLIVLYHLFCSVGFCVGLQ